MEAKATILSRIPPAASAIVKRVVDAGKAFGKARATLGSALFDLHKARVAEAIGVDFDTLALGIATESGFELSRSTLRNAVRIGTVREAAPDAVKGLGDTVVLRMAEALGEAADDPAAVRDFATAVKAEGGTTESVRKVRAAKMGGQSGPDRESVAISKAAEIIAKLWREDAVGQTRALASVARTLGLNGVAEMLELGRDAIEAAAIRKAAKAAEPEPTRKAARPSAERVAEAAARMAEADAKAEAKAAKATKAAKAK